jgi:hypothetical protein
MKTKKVPDLFPKEDTLLSFQVISCKTEENNFELKRLKVLSAVLGCQIFSCTTYQNITN